MDFDFPKLIAYYDKVLAGCLKFGGEDWRLDLYRERRDRIASLSAAESLTPSETQYLTARQAIAGVF